MAERLEATAQHRACTARREHGSRANREVIAREVVIGGGAGNPVQSGSASPAITLAVGSNTINVIVNPNNGADPSTYDIDAERAAP